LTVKEKIYKIIESALNRGISEGVFPQGDYPQIKVEYPREQKFGDYSTPFALESAKILKKNPIETGEQLKKYIEESEIIERVDVVRPGFINIFLSHEYMCKSLEDITANKDEYGRQKKENPLKINIEFVSANPTGPMNIVSARAAAIGDTIANLIEANGDIAEREFYVNDYGNQVNLLGRSVLARIRELKGEDFDFPEDGYHGEYIRDIAQYIIDNNCSEFESCSNEEEIVEFVAVKAIEYNVGGQKKDLENFNVHFKTWFREKKLHENDDVTQSLLFLESHDSIYEKEAKKFFRSTDYGDDKDRVVVRDDGRPTYLLADIAYHRDKINRGYNRIIDIWGPDHHGYIARLSGAMRAMGYPEKNFNVLIAQQVNLVMEGETVKMSKRLGRFSTMKELLDDVGADVARYFFIMRSLDSHLDFDLALAKKSSSENPVFYLQYAHARICSIFRQAETKGIKYSPSVYNSEELNNPEAVSLLKLMIKFPEEVADAAENYEPHRIANYLLKLAQGFHRFYTEHRIVSEDAIKTSTFLVLSDSIRIVMKNGLTLLGVSAPEKM